MVAYAQCLWTAGLSVPRRAPLGSGLAGRGLFGPSHADDRRPDIRSSGCRQTLLTAPNLSSYDLCALAAAQTPSCMSERDGGSLDRMGERSTDRRLNEIHGGHHFRSLSYLSLTLRCAALPSGWLEGCVTPSFARRHVRVLATIRRRRARCTLQLMSYSHSPAPWQSRGPQGALPQAVGVPSEDLACSRRWPSWPLGCLFFSPLPFRIAQGGLSVTGVYGDRSIDSSRDGTDPTGVSSRPSRASSRSG